MYQIVTKMKSLKKPLRKLLYAHGNLHERVKTLRNELDEVQKALDKNPNDVNLRDEEATYVQALTEAKLDEERFLKQKAKIEWLEVRDSNSAFFHKSVKSGNRSSRIEVIRGADNVEVTGTLVADVFVTHYQQFLGTSRDCEDLDTQGLFINRISDESSHDMVRHVTNNEVKQAMFSIGDDRAPGPDGFTSAFFKKSWDVVGPDICNVVRDFFVNGKLLKEVNHTFLAVIPKMSTPIMVTDYRSISCCNVLYKCISKILTNRIIGGINKAVSENQSAFILGRRISDNILITQELMHNYHRNRGPPRCAFKVDIQNVYDNVDWKFLANILKCFGFHDTMIKWIMACVTSASFSLSLNGDIHDDIFIFARGELDSARLIIESLDEFQKSSGLVPSIPKSTTYFCNVRNHVKHAILNLMPFAEGELPVKYLGVPLISTRLLNRDYTILVERVLNRIGDWKKNRYPLRDVFNWQHMRGFLWCNGELKRGKAKVAWDAICLLKHEGGLGIRSLEQFNIALMMTHIRNIVKNKQSLWVQWIHIYKLRGRTIWDVPNKADMSWGEESSFRSGLIIRYLSPRDITNEGYHLQNCVADLVSNEGWSWPQAWLLEAPDLGSIPVSVLVDSQLDTPQWREINGNLSNFSIKCAWEALRPCDIEVPWHQLVWFSHCIPHHAFNLWLVMRNSLKTHDQLRQ
ncbi:protein LAZ1 [Tanacetum coccineum]